MIQNSTLLRAAWLGMALSALPLGAHAESAQDVLNHVKDTYSRATSLHIVAKREEVISKGGQSGVSSSDIEIALVGRQKYFARIKTNGQESVAMSDGEHTWKAIPSKKQWMQVAAAALETRDAEGPDPRSRDLYTTLVQTLAGRYIALTKAAEEPQITGEEDMKVGGQKIRCYVIRMQAGGFEHQLWIDQQRFVVLEHKEKGNTNGLHAETHLKISAVEVNAPIADPTFRFEPGKGWSEAEMLLLPGEERLMLTGSRAANFTLKSLDGDAVALDQTRGKVVVLDFWATWCPPCREELPYVVKLRQEFAGKVEFYGINDEDSGTVKDFLRKHSYDMTVLMDGKRQVHRQYGVSSIPTMLIIDKQGVIREHFIGSRSEAKLRQALETVVAAN
ncbi:MAG TPA: TlpA disulfide reductase family protein [Bryobacteraceae bacterium]|nr:TlpA disulfide reductase family protein [Bryobacteraceae bacterium]